MFVTAVRCQRAFVNNAILMSGFSKPLVSHFSWHRPPRIYRFDDLRTSPHWGENSRSLKPPQGLSVHGEPILHTQNKQTTLRARPTFLQGRFVPANEFNFSMSRSASPISHTGPVRVITRTQLSTMFTYRYLQDVTSTDGYGSHMDTSLRKREIIRRTIDDHLVAMRASQPWNATFHVIHDLIHIGIIDRAMTLAAQSFTSILPVMMALSTLGLTDVVPGMGGNGISAVLKHSPTPSVALGFVGVLLLMVSATSYARALGRCHAKIWHVTTLTYRQAWRWLATILIVVGGSLAVVVSYSLSVDDTTARVMALILQSVIWWSVWSSVPAILVPYYFSRATLFACGGITSIGLITLQLATPLVVPRLIETSGQQFGVLGVMVTLVGWLFAFSAVVIGAPALVKSLQESRTCDVSPRRFPDPRALRSV